MLSWANKHTTRELAKDDSTRSGPQVQGKWVQDTKGDEVQCRLVAKQLAIGERLDDTQSKPPLIVAWRLWATASLHVDELGCRTVRQGIEWSQSSCQGMVWAKHKRLRDVKHYTRPHPHVALPHTCFFFSFGSRRESSSQQESLCLTKTVIPYI